MRRKAWGIILFLSLLSPVGLKGQGLNHPTSESAPESPIAMRYYLAKTIIRTTDGKSHYGLLAGIDKDTLILKKGKDEEGISLRDLSAVSIELEKRTGSLLTAGMALGLYLGNVIFCRAEGQPFAYLDENTYSEAGVIFGDFIFASAGIGLGYLASLWMKGEAVFRFGGQETERLAEWGRLKGFLAGRRNDKKIHFTVQAGRVFSTVHDRYRKAFNTAGYDTGYGFGIISPGRQHHEYVDAAMKFNLLRKAQLTVSLSPKIELGAAVVFSGEPGIGGYDHRSSGQLNVWQTLSATGYYAVAAYRPLGETWPRRIRWKAGLGLGASRVDFKLGMYTYGYYPDYEEKWAEHRLVQTVPSGMAFTELSYFFSPNVSVGLTADYVFGPSKDIPEFPEWNIPAQKIRLGNGCVGVALGMHF